MQISELTAPRREQGHCWTWSLPPELPNGENLQSPSTATLFLFEEGRLLGPARASHSDIRARGAGRFSHWERTLFFSTTDNSDPRRNRRRYQVLWFDANDPAGRSHAQSTSAAATREPVNLSSPDASDEAIERDAHYAMTVARSYANLIEASGTALAGKRVLEFGPGHNLGSALILKCLGAAQVAVADRFVPPYQTDYHSRVYRRIASLLKCEGCSNVLPLESSVAIGSHVPALELIEKPLEHLSALTVPPFDITLSNAVFEHLFDPFASIKNLAALTLPEGLGFHQVDFRDHRRFDRPLEFLLLDEFSFVRLFQDSHGETGNRVRPHQMEAMFKAARFRSTDFVGDSAASDDYLDDLVPRLSACAVSPYSMLTREQLRPIGGRFVVRR